MHTFIFLVLIKNINGGGSWNVTPHAKYGCMRAGSSDNRSTRRQGLWKYRGVNRPGNPGD